MSESEPMSFRDRSRAFWRWFSENADTFYQAIENGDFDPHVETVTQRMEQLLPGAAWCFGPGENGVGHSFTLSPEGSPYMALLMTHLVKQAPDLEGWTFYDSRQASPNFDGMKMNIADETISAQEIWVTPSVDADRETIDLVCWAPVFEKLPERDRGQIIFLWLDEAIGEFQVGNRLGYIDINTSGLQNAIPLSELPDYIKEMETKHGWERKTPGEYYTGYNFREPKEFDPEHVRSDIFTGTSLLYELSSDFSRDRGQMEHPLPKLGVDFIFIKIPVELFAPGQQVDERGEIEDALETVLDEQDSGIVLGGAAGHQAMYVELAILDAEHALSAIRKVLEESEFGKAAQVYYFDKERVAKPIW
ncbi:hypothetical protein [Oceaniferula spumae]